MISIMISWTWLYNDLTNDFINFFHSIFKTIDSEISEAREKLAEASDYQQSQQIHSAIAKFEKLVSHNNRNGEDDENLKKAKELMNFLILQESEFNTSWKIIKLS